MTPRQPRTTGHLLAIAALMTSVACSDRPTPTDPSAPDAAVARPRGRLPRITSLNLASTTLVIDGRQTSYTVTVQNPAAPMTDVVLQGTIVQGAVVRAAGGFSANCPPSAVGTLPSGTCEMSFTAGASNALGGSGTLVPGSASFVLTMTQTVGTTQTLLDVAVVPITLVARPSITSLVLSSTTLFIDGPGTSYEVSVLNPTGSSQTDIVLQGELTQGSVTHAAGGLSANCPPSPIGTLPTGSCTMTFSANASNLSGGAGTLVPGPATFVLKLYQITGGVAAVLDSRSVAVTLASPAPSITSLVLSSTTLPIDGESVTYTVSVLNPTFVDLPGIALVQGELLQGSTVRGAGGTNVVCGAASGVLPPGTCTFQFTALASNSVGGTGTLVPGATDFVLKLYQYEGVTLTEHDSETVPVTLVPNHPAITSLVLSSTTLTIDGESTTYSVTVSNPSSATLAGIALVQGELHQGTTVHGAGGTNVICGAGSGVLPPGSCTFEFVAVASNLAGGSGTLVPGSAEFTLKLYQFDAGTLTEHDSRTVAVTLANP